jgi:hypothetical protein
MSTAFLANIGDALDEMFQALCVVTGFVLIPGTIAAWAWFIRRRRRNARGAAKGVAVGATVLLFVWILLAFSVGPPYPVTGSMAAYKVHNLPEVLALEKELNGFSDSGPNSRNPYWQFSFRKNDPNGKAIMWHRFRVSANDGTVYVSVDEVGEEWMTLEEWRKGIGERR